MTKPPIPEAILGQHTAVLGKTGSGKTSTEKLLIEQVVAAGARVCVLDTLKSDWWGITSSTDGKRAGLPFHILGGPRGHMALPSSAGAAVAEVVASGALPLSIIDMADFEPGGPQRFFVDFAPILLRKMTGVLYLVIEEAHELAPKERAGFGAESMAIHWAKKLATAGRSRGIRLVVATQRVQALHNAVLGSCETVIVHRLTTPADQKPILDWLKANAPKNAIEEVSGSLSSLKTGTGWLCSGEAQIFSKVAFPRIKTFDNSATPTGKGEDLHVRTAAVDLDKLRSVIGDAAAEAEANDPKTLKQKVAELTRQLADKPAPPAVRGASVPETDEQALRRPAVRKAIADAAAAGEARGAETAHKGFMARIAGMMRSFGSVIAKVEETDKGLTAIRTALEGLAATPPVAAAPAKAPLVKGPRTNGHAPPPAAGGDGITAGQQRILDALAFMLSIGVRQVDRTQVALLADQSPTSSTYGQNLSTLVRLGLASYPGSGTVGLTSDGEARANSAETVQDLATLHGVIKRRLRDGEARILGCAIDAFPDPIERDVLAAEVKQSPTSSTYGQNLARLRSLGFIDYRQGSIVATSILFPDGLA